MVFKHHFERSPKTHTHLAVGQSQWDPILVGRFTTHFRTYFFVGIEITGGTIWLLTHGHSSNGVEVQRYNHPGGDGTAVYQTGVLLPDISPEALEKVAECVSSNMATEFDPKCGSWA